MKIIPLFNVLQNIPSAYTTAYSTGDINETTGFGVQKHVESNIDSRLPVKGTITGNTVNLLTIASIGDVSLLHKINSDSDLTNYLDTRELFVPFNTFGLLGTTFDKEVTLSDRPGNEVEYISTGYNPTVSPSSISPNTKTDILLEFDSDFDTGNNLGFLRIAFEISASFSVDISIDNIVLGYKLPLTRKYNFGYNINYLNPFDNKSSSKKQIYSNRTLNKSLKEYSIRIEYLDIDDFRHLTTIIEVFGDIYYFVELEQGESMFCRLKNFDYKEFRNPGNNFNVSLVFEEVEIGL